MSLIDFTQQGLTIDTTVFQGLDNYVWTSSRVLGGDGSWHGEYWTVDFSTGLVSASATGNQVLCVQGGP